MMPIVTTLVTGAMATASAYAIVTTDATKLQAAPSDAAAQQAVLWQGDLLEVRGRRRDHLQVYDHRRERAGYVLASQVRTTAAEPADAPELLSVLRFVRDTPGAEALGIAYAAAYLKAVPAGAMTAEPFDALGTMADRLARRASTKQVTAASSAIAAHLEVVAGYGVAMKSYEHDGAMQVCYDGDAFRRVLAMATAGAEQRARAALGLTRPECIDPDLSPPARLAADRLRTEVLDRAEATTALPETLRNRLRLRRAAVESALAFAHAGRADPDTTAAATAAQHALQALAGVDRSELTDDDQAEYQQAAIRVGASRWAAEPPAVAAPGRLQVRTVAGEPGQTCVLLTRASMPIPLLRRCTWGAVWTASASVSPNGEVLALAVQPLAGWRELWVFRHAAAGWSVDVVPPAAGDPLGGDIGYAEFAGWVPGGDRLLLARESRVDARTRRSFEVLRLDTLATEKQSSTPALLAAFAKWQDPAWKRQTVSVR